MGLWEWILVALRGEPATDLVPSSTPAPQRPGGPAAAAAALANPDPVSGFFELIGFPEAPVPPLGLQESAEDDVLVAEVLDHVRASVAKPQVLPTASLEALGAVSKPDLSLRELTHIVSMDPSTSAAVLRVANSPAYAGVQEFQTIRDAVTRLGQVEVARIAGIVAARSLFQPEVHGELARFAPRLSAIFAESVTTARGAAYLALQSRGARSDLAFLAGMLVDLGRSVALRSLATVASSIPESELPPARIDRVVERVHLELGGEAHESFGLPTFSTLAARRHHELPLATDGELMELHRVRLVATLVQLRGQPWRSAPAKAELDDSSKALGLDALALRSLDTHLREDLEIVRQRFVESAGTPRGA
jgi:HD-like signal output (HDOD) protein